MIFEAELPGGRAAFSTRYGGVSTGPFQSLNLAVKTGDENERVAERLRQAQGADLHEWLEPPGPPGWATMGRELRHAGGPSPTSPVSG